MDIDRLEELLEAKTSIAEISRAPGVSRRTLYKYIQEHGIENEGHANITEHNLRADSEEVMVTGHLRSQGIYVQRQRIRDNPRDIDAKGIQRRRTHAVQRRVYSVPRPHFI